MTELHRTIPALCLGSLKPLLAGDHLIAYGRFINDSICAVAVSNHTAEQDILIPVWQLGMKDGETMSRVMLTYESGYNVGKITFAVEQGSVRVLMPPLSSVLLVGDRE